MNVASVVYSNIQGTTNEILPIVKPYKVVAL